MIEEKSGVPNFSETCSMLKRTAVQHGPTSAIGRRCFNILELMYEMPRPPEEWIDYLMPDSVPEQRKQCLHSIERQMVDLNRLLAA